MVFTFNRVDSGCAIVEFLPLRSNLATPPVSAPSNAQRARAGIRGRKRVNRAGMGSSAGARRVFGRRLEDGDVRSAWNAVRPSKQ